LEKVNITTKPYNQTNMIYLNSSHHFDHHYWIFIFLFLAYFENLDELKQHKDIINHRYKYLKKTIPRLTFFIVVEW